MQKFKKWTLSVRSALDRLPWGLLLPSVILAIISIGLWLGVSKYLSGYSELIVITSYAVLLVIFSVIIIYSYTLKLSARFSQVREQARNLLSMFDNLPEVFLVTNLDGEIQDISPTAAVWLHSAREEWLGRRFGELFHDPGEYNTFLSLLLERTRLENYSLTLKRSASERQVLVNAFLERDVNGMPIGIHCTLRDVTDINKLVTQRQTAIRMDNLTDYTGRITRELSTLVYEIRDHTQKLENIIKSKKDLHTLQSDVENFTILMRHLETFGQKQTSSPQRLDLNTFITKYAALMARNHDTEIDLDLSSQIPAIMADPGQMEQIILSMTDNALHALKAAKSAKPAIVIQTGLRSLDLDFVRGHSAGQIQPGDYIMLSISDNGIGMDKKTQEHIFEPFYTTVPYASGLGLSIVYGIVRQNGGFINVYSEAGHGTSYHIYWPVPREQVAQVQPRESGEGHEGLVLLVDDNNEFLSYISTVLEATGYAVTQCTNAAQALEMHQQGMQPDLVIADYIMPGMDGLELVAELAQRGLRAPVIVTSGFVRLQVTGEEQPETFMVFLQKPFTRHELLQAIDEAFEKYLNQ